MRIDTPENIDMVGISKTDFMVRIDHTNKQLQWRKNESTSKLSPEQKKEYEEKLNKQYSGYTWLRQYGSNATDITVWATDRDDANRIFESMGIKDQAIYTV